MDKTQQQINNLVFELIQTNRRIEEVANALREGGYLAPQLAYTVLRDATAASRRLNLMIKE